MLKDVFAENTQLFFSDVLKKVLMCLLFSEDVQQTAISEAKITSD